MESAQRLDLSRLSVLWLWDVMFSTEWKKGLSNYGTAHRRDSAGFCEP